MVCARDRIGDLVKRMAIMELPKAPRQKYMTLPAMSLKSATMMLIHGMSIANQVDRTFGLMA